jgi:hypothetical protein
LTSVSALKELQTEKERLSGETEMEYAERVFDKGKYCDGYVHAFQGGNEVFQPDCVRSRE